MFLIHTCDAMWCKPYLQPRSQSWTSRHKLIIHQNASLGRTVPSIFSASSVKLLLNPPWWCGASHPLEPFKRPPLSLESWWWTARCVWNIWIHQPLLYSQSRNSTKFWCSDDDHGEGGEKFVDEWFSPLGKPAKLINIIVMFRWVVRKFHAYIPYYIPI